MSHEASTNPEHRRLLQAWQMIQHHLGQVNAYFTPEYTEIMVNPDGKVWVDSHSQGMVCTPHTLSEESRRTIIESVASATSQTVHAELPQLDGTLPIVGYRFAGLLKPAVSAPAFSIRLANEKVLTLKHYMDSGALTQSQARLLLVGVKERQNILVVGGTGSGKTMLSNALLDVMTHSNHRILTIEDTPELKCNAPNHIGLRVIRDSAFTYRQALHLALRLRPDRIVVGELRDGIAALELLKAWNTGHNGGLATLHANSAESALPRLEQILEEEVQHAPKALIAEAVDLIVFMERYTPSGTSARAWRAVDLARVHNRLDGRGGYALTHCYHETMHQSGGTP